MAEQKKLVSFGLFDDSMATVVGGLSFGIEFPLLEMFTEL